MVAGAQTMMGMVSALSTRAYVLMPTHPGFAGEPRPAWFDSVDDLAITYLDLLEQLDLQDVMVVGSSMGGWIAAEMAVRDTTRLSSIVLVNAAGIQVEGHPIADVFPLTPDELSALSFTTRQPFASTPPNSALNRSPPRPRTGRRSRSTDERWVCLMRSCAAALLA